ncbi:MAG: PTS sugar transporter subunit IIA [Phycisphaeraceae bacterium]|nr:PTS sugar transporter subunit IIA [Phycisphaeraceae bacterium]
MKLMDFVVEEAIVADLKGSQRDDVIKELVDVLVASGAAPKAVREELIKLILDREKHGSTGFGKGVAVPHVKHDKIKHMAAAIGVSSQGVDFNALDKAPVFSIVLLLSPKDKAADHLHAMESIFSNLQKDTFRRFLRQASTVQEVKELLQEADAQQLH